jgi:hypothetical protein
MSAYSGGRPPQIISLPNAGTGAGSGGSNLGFDESPNPNYPGVFDKLEGFIQATRQLEAALQQERARSRKLQDDFKHAQSTYERLLSESQSRARELELDEAKAKASLAAHEANEKTFQSRLDQIAGELRKTQAELSRYRAAWAGVLQREKEAKLILADSEANARKMARLEAALKAAESGLQAEKEAREQTTRHAKSYQNELQNTLVRLHSAEAKFNEISKELRAVSQSRRNLDEEVAKIEASMRERLQWECVKEREKIKAELEKSAALEREQFRQEARREFKAELDQALAFERNHFARTCVELEAEIARLRDAAQKAEREAQEARARADQAQSEVEQARRNQEEATEALAIRHEQAQARLRAELEAELEATRARLTEEMASARAEAAEQIVRTNGAAEALIDEAQREAAAQVLEAQSAAEAARAEAERRIAESESLAALKVVEAQNASASRVAATESAAERRVNEISRESAERLSAADARVESLQTELSRNRNQTVILRKVAEGEVARLKREFHARMAEAHAEIEAARKAAGEDARERIQAVRDQAGAMEAELRAEIELAGERARAIEAEINQARGETASFRDELAKALGMTAEVDRFRALLEESRGESQALRVEIERISDGLEKEYERCRSLENGFIAEKMRFDELALALSGEVQQMLLASPLTEAIRAKEIEIESLNRQLETEKNELEVARIHRTLGELYSQHERLRDRVKESEVQVAAQIARLREAMESNVIPADPA